MKHLLCFVFLVWASVAQADIIPAKAAYDVIQADGAFEVRQYPPLAYATVPVTAASNEAAIQEGFDRLLAYLNGHNRENTRMPLTLPLMQSYRGHDGVITWEARCILPARYLTQPAPLTLDTGIQTGTTLETRWAVIRFSGAPTADNMRKQAEKLRRWIVQTAKRGFADAPRYAFFSPPWLPPFLRHNEIMLPVMD